MSIYIFFLYSDIHFSLTCQSLDPLSNWINIDLEMCVYYIYIYLSPYQKATQKQPYIALTFQRHYRIVLFPNVIHIYTFYVAKRYIWECRFSGVYSRFGSPTTLFLSPISRTKRRDQPTYIIPNNIIMCSESSHAEFNTKHKQEGSIYISWAHIGIYYSNRRTHAKHPSIDPSPYLSLIVLMRILLCCVQPNK